MWLHWQPANYRFAHKSLERSAIWLIFKVLRGLWNRTTAKINLGKQRWISGLLTLLTFKNYKLHCQNRAFEDWGSSKLWCYSVLSHTASFDEHLFQHFSVPRKVTTASASWGNVAGGGGDSPGEGRSLSFCERAVLRKYSTNLLSGKTSRSTQTEVWCFHE